MANDAEKKKAQAVARAQLKKDREAAKLKQVANPKFVAPNPKDKTNPPALAGCCDPLINDDKLSTKRDHQSESSNKTKMDKSFHSLVNGKKNLSISPRKMAWSLVCMFQQSGSVNHGDVC